MSFMSLCLKKDNMSFKICPLCLYVLKEDLSFRICLYVLKRNLSLSSTSLELARVLLSAASRKALL